MFKKLIIFPLIFILFYGCSKSVSPVDSAIESGVFHFGNGSEPQGIDPHVVTGVPEHHILIALCEGLTIANPYGEGNLPGVAESWTISDDGKEYIFGHFYDKGSIANVQTLTAGLMYMYGVYNMSFGISNVYIGQKENKWKGFVIFK